MVERYRLFLYKIEYMCTIPLQVLHNVVHVRPSVHVTYHVDHLDEQWFYHWPILEVLQLKPDSLSL